MNSLSVSNIIKKNSRFYLIEAVGIAGFVMLAGSLTVFLEHPDMPVMKTALADHPFLRRVLLGIAIGLYVGFTVYLFGKLSGTHVNPSVTWAFYRLGNISFLNAVMYIIAQFAGALVGVYLLKGLMGNLFAYPLIDYGVSKPKPPYNMTDACIAEFIISFILMLSVLFISSSRRLEKYTALVTGILLALFIIIELPYSGMSMNPARSFAAALVANEWEHLWVYFVSPVLAMLLAAELFVIWRKRRIAANNKDYKEIGIYPA